MRLVRVPVMTRLDYGIFIFAGLPETTLGLPTVPYFGPFVLRPGKGLPGTQNVPFCNVFLVNTVYKRLLSTQTAKSLATFLNSM
jgi:hypothetical protein